MRRPNGTVFPVIRPAAALGPAALAMEFAINHLAGPICPSLAFGPFSNSGSVASAALLGKRPPSRLAIGIFFAPGARDLR